ncbi:LysR family transcriptional regulator [Corynebacterium variabile]|nr:LysR family transcriptional regulator [Corynebacterium variabile]
MCTVSVHRSFRYIAVQLPSPVSRCGVRPEDVRCCCATHSGTGRGLRPRPRHGSFSRAARAMGRSQSTVSTSIANLEIALDTELFDRSSRFPVLTAEDETLLQEAKALYDRGHAYERLGDSLFQGQPTNITLAVGIPTVSSPLYSPGSPTSSPSST